MFRIGQRARTETVQETLTPLAERLGALPDRRIIGGQQRLEQFAGRQR